MFRQRFGQFKTFMSNSGVYNNQKFGISTKTHKNNFDKMLNKWCQAVFPGKSIALSLAGLNLGLWLWCNFTTNKEKRWISFESLSYSENSHKNRDYINLFASGLLSRRIDDLVFDVGVMAVLGRMLEVRHGLPFMFKLTLCAWYFGVLTSAFFVTKPIANRNNRYFYENPRGNSGFGKDYYFMSAHGVSSSIAYYWLYKNMAILILPALLADLYIWGPYYSNGPLAGLVFGALL